jgi:hypothetical protein
MVMKKRILTLTLALAALYSPLSEALAGLGTINVTTSETLILPANDRRRWVVLQNTSSGDIWVKVDSSTTTLTPDSGIKLAPGATLTLTDNGQANPAINAIKAISASGSNALNYSEGNEH